MFIRSLLKLHSYRKFDYRPRYNQTTRDKFNEKRLQKNLPERNPHRETTYESLKENSPINFRKQWGADKRKNSTSRSSLRIAILFVILLGICYYILN